MALLNAWKPRSSWAAGHPGSGASSRCSSAACAALRPGRWGASRCTRSHRWDRVPPCGLGRIVMATCCAAFACRSEKERTRDALDHGQAWCCVAQAAGQGGKAACDGPFAAYQRAVLGRIFGTSAGGGGSRGRRGEDASGGRHWPARALAVTPAAPPGAAADADGEAGMPIPAPAAVATPAAAHKLLAYRPELNCGSLVEPAG